MKATALVAFDKNYGIGIEGKLPWVLPEDLALFKARTLGQAVILGSKTYDSLPDKNRPLPGRTNIVLSHRARPRCASLHIACNRVSDKLPVVFVQSETIAMQVAAELKSHPFVIGGEQIYKLFLQRGLVDEVIASEVKGEYDCDSWFPAKLIDSFSGWDRQVIKEYEKFTVVRYITITKMREDMDALHRQLAVFEKSARAANAQYNAIKRQIARQYQDEADYLPYEEDDR